MACMNFQDDCRFLEESCPEDFDEIIWARVETGYEVQSIRSCHYDAVMKLIIELNENDNTAIKLYKIPDDEKSLKHFKRKTRLIMKQGTSLCLIDEKTKDVIGALIMLIVPKLNYGRVMSREDLTSSLEPGDECVISRIELFKKIDIYATYKCESFVRFYLLCIDTKIASRKRLETVLMHAGLQVVQTLNVPIACGIFIGEKNQKSGKEMGFVKVVGNTNCLGSALMIREVPPPRRAALKVKDHEPEEQVKEGKDKGKKKKAKSVKSA